MSDLFRIVTGVAAAVSRAGADLCSFDEKQV
jgi:hypothetical protein